MMAFSTHKIMTMKCILLVVLFGSLVGTVYAQSDIEDDPGYASFGDLSSIYDRDPSLEVNLHGVLLRLVAESSRVSDPELADMLGDVRAIYVIGFHLRRTEYRKAIRRNRIIADRLKRKGWESAVSVRDDGENVHMFVRMQRGEIVGLTVLSVRADEGESVYLNIVGKIDPEQIGRIGDKFDLEGLRDW